MSDLFLQHEPQLLAKARPPLRWAGSKKRLLKHLVSRVPPRHLRYIEPFAGSAILFFSIASRESVVSDVNLDLIEFYRNLRAHPRELHELLLSHTISKEAYITARQRLSISTGMERSSLFWYLNRCCFNGIYRTNRNGQFNVPFGSKLPPMPNLNEAISWSKQLHHCDLLCGDFHSPLATADAGDFVYLDPPYARSQPRDRGEYGPRAMQPQHIPELAAAAVAAAERGAKLLISYNRDISELLDGWKTEVVSVRRDVSANVSMRVQATEYLFRNY